MKSDDIGKRIVVFESQDKNGITGTIIEVFDVSFRIKTDKGIIYEFSPQLVNIKFVGGS